VIRAPKRKPEMPVELADFLSSARLL